MIVTAALAGLPLALILGGFFDLAEGGVVRTPSRGLGPPQGLRLVQGVALVLTLAVTGLLGWYNLLR